ncbi:MAG: outer membrane protein assembly factor BamD [Calditrichaeota bacterium]|nr:outer membrane protein assembly factor BamD [Calditrichota bacterium]MCB9391559.1 outer membrane protein assembly factor BamD [Calditrichota bacterium]
MTTFRILGVTLLLGVLFLGCASKTRFVSDQGVEADWARAKSLFERERFYRAQQLLRDITLNYSGSAIIDSAYFYLGLAGYEQEDYVIAADDFRRLVQQFPSSPLAAGAAYYESLCQFEQTPDYRLDQSFTEQAFNGFQRFLEEYPQNAYTDSAYVYLAKCREKLARKEFAALKLYLKLEEYASVVIYSDAILADYYDTSYADEAAFDKIRALHKLEELERTRMAIADYYRRFPSGKYSGAVRSIERQVGASESQALTP